MKNPARGHKVEKHHHPEGKSVQRTYSPYKEKAEIMVQKKNSEKASSPNKQKGKKKEKKTRVAIGTPAYRRTIERRAAASTKALRRKQSKTKQT